jgi:hypothetical protein
LVELPGGIIKTNFCARLPLRLLYFKTGERIQIKSLLRRDKQKKQKNASFKAMNCVIFAVGVYAPHDYAYIFTG